MSLEGRISIFTEKEKMLILVMLANVTFYFTLPNDTLHPAYTLFKYTKPTYTQILASRMSGRHLDNQTLGNHTFGHFFFEKCQFQANNLKVSFQCVGYYSIALS